MLCSFGTSGFVRSLRPQSRSDRLRPGACSLAPRIGLTDRRRRRQVIVLLSRLLWALYAATL